MKQSTYEKTYILRPSCIFYLMVEDSILKFNKFCMAIEDILYTIEYKIESYMEVK